MKSLTIAFFVIGGLAHATPYSERNSQVEAQETAQAYARAAQTEALATQKLQDDLKRIASKQGGLVSSSVRVSLIGNTLIQGGEMSLVTGNNLVCDPIVGNTLCRDASCSNAKFWVINCIDSQGQRCKLDLNGNRYSYYGGNYKFPVRTHSVRKKSHKLDL